MPTWLNSQKKARLAELAAIVNIASPEELVDWRKDQLVPALEHVLSHNPRFQQNPAFEEYFQRRNSPLKRFQSKATSVQPASSERRTSNLDVLFPRSKRTVDLMKAGTEVDDQQDQSSSPNNIASPNQLSSPSMAAIGNTTNRFATTTGAVPASTPAPAPTAASRVRENVHHGAAQLAAQSAAPLPPSPAIVAEMIEAQTARFNAEVGEIWASTRIMEILNQLRVEFSSMIGIHLAILALEFYYLQADVTVWRFLVDIPTPFFTLTVPYPDLFVYLSGYWVTMLTAWSLLSFWIPLTASWFCNLSLKLKHRHGVEYWQPRYTVDPLTFNITRGFLAWLVYTQGQRLFGLLADETVLRVERALPGGVQGVLISSAVGVLASLWDAVQGKKGFE